MVNFRFHVVSIIAIFLAIAIGTVMGATFVGRGVIDNLQGRIDKVENSRNDVISENEALQSAPASASTSWRSAASTAPRSTRRRNCCARPARPCRV